MKHRPTLVLWVVPEAERLDALRDRGGPLGKGTGEWSSEEKLFDSRERMQAPGSSKPGLSLHTLLKCRSFCKSTGFLGGLEIIIRT